MSGTVKSEQRCALNVIVHRELRLRGFPVSRGQVSLGRSLNEDTQTDSASEKETIRHHESVD